MFEVIGKYTTAKIMIDNVDEETLKQIYEFISHEAFTKPISIMPDTHAGKGAVIGFTMELGDKVIPNVIGVDKGCFTGDTKVPLLNGLQYTFLELLNMGEFYVYSMNEKLQLVPGKAKCIMTKENTEIIEVGISGGEIVRCTPDQPFMLIDGSYKKAEDLIPKSDCLMPLYRSYDTRDGYESIHSYHSRAIHTHNMVAEYFLGKKDKDLFTHHKDELWFNNSPENLEYINKNEHSSNHAKKRNYFSKDEFKLKRKQTFIKKGKFFDERFLVKKQETIKTNFKNYLEKNREEWLEKVKDNGKRGSKYLQKLSGTYICDKCGRVCKNKGAFNRHNKIHKNNHKVLFIRKIDSKENVYCLQVEKYHNFAISAGVIVHNCGMLSFDIGQGTLKDLVPERIDELIRSVIPFGTDVNKKFEKNGIELLINLSNPQIRSFVLEYNKRYGTSNVTPFINEDSLIERSEKFGIDYDRVVKSIGTLGGGNHFIEVGISQYTGNTWITVHSGSRQYGLKSATYHQRKAGKNELSYLTGNDMFEYLIDLIIAQTYAFVNRMVMMKKILNALNINPVGEPITSIHNYISTRDFIIRKGAISSYANEKMIIPFNMEDGILICKGKSNAEWNYSAPHGAGRIGSRRWANENLSNTDAQERMKEKGIYFSKLPTDELKGAYKDPKIIEDSIEPTAEIIDRIKPIIACKE